MRPLEELSFRLAAALLMKQGELSFEDIQALPFVESRQLANAIALGLVNRLQAQWEDDTVRLALSPFPAKAHAQSDSAFPDIPIDELLRTLLLTTTSA